MTRREKPFSGITTRGLSGSNAGIGGTETPPSQAPILTGGRDNHPSLQQNAAARLRVRRVALLAMDDLDLDAVCYALSACERMDARLDVLTNLPAEEANRAVIAARGTSDTPWRIVRIGGDSGDGLSHYVVKEAGLLFLTSSASDEKARSLRDESNPTGNRSGVSWVVVEGRK